MSEELAKALCTTMQAIHARGWCDGTGGNFSCVSRTEPLELLMAPSGVDKGSLHPQDLILVNAAGAVIAGEGKASAETLLHLRIVAVTGAGAVLHTHSQAATLLSRRALQTPLQPLPQAGRASGTVVIEGLEMLKGLEGINTHDAEVAIPVLANDQDLRRLSETAAPCLANAPHGLLIAGHGLYAWGDDLFSAKRHLEILEFLLEQRWRELMVSNTASMGPATDSPARGTSTAIVLTGISHVLLDIEGTTCPVSFVAETLFPYARQRLDSYLREHQQDPAIRVLLDDVARSWALEQTSAVSGLGGTVADGGAESGGSSDPGAPTLRQLVDFLASLIDQDRKLTALKELQGLIWEEGYGNGSLQAPLFDDVPQTLRAWVATGLRLAVYSSGSVAAQQLLYGHSKAGDLRPLFSDWFDTHVGPKQDPASYLRIAASLRARPSAMLFLSDSRAELEAASQAGLNVLFSHRLGNPEVSSGPYTAFTSLQDLAITPAADCVQLAD